MRVDRRLNLEPARFDAAGAVTGMCVAWVKLGKPDISMMLYGALGGLVAITAASGFVAPCAASIARSTSFRRA